MFSASTGSLRPAAGDVKRRIDPTFSRTEKVRRRTNLTSRRRQVSERGEPMIAFNRRNLRRFIGKPRPSGRTSAGGRVGMAQK